jgi:hypothetical protein
MLAHRDWSSSKYYSDLVPCVVSKSLITKYQKNPKCKQVRNLVIPVCGDKGKQIKLVERGIRIPALFRKEVLPVSWPRQITGHVRSVELFRREGEWFASICYYTSEPSIEAFDGVIGVDRNSVGNIVVFGDMETGTVRKLGICPARTKYVFRHRRKNLQRAGKTRLLKKLHRKHRRRMSYENHRATRAVVDYAATFEKILEAAIEKVGVFNPAPTQPGARVGWSVVPCVLDLGKDTEGPPIEMPGKKMDPEEGQQFLKAASNFAESKGAKVTTEAGGGGMGESGAVAVYRRRDGSTEEKIYLARWAGLTEHCKTVLHEIAHFLAGHHRLNKSKPEIKKEQSKAHEHIAEATAYVVGRQFGVPMEYSAAYSKNCSDEKRIKRKWIIHSISSQIIRTEDHGFYVSRAEPRRQREDTMVPAARGSSD